MCDSLRVHFVWDSLFILNLDICSFFRLRISRNFIKHFSACFSSLSGTLIMWILVYLILLQKYLKVSSFYILFLFFFHFYCVILSSQSSMSLMHSSVSLNQLLIHSSAFFHLSYHVLQLWLILFYTHSHSLLKFSLCSSILFLCSVAIFIITVLNILSGKLSLFH